jgi:hypothetical protein
MYISVVFFVQLQTDFKAARESFSKSNNINLNLVFYNSIVN